MNLLGIIGRVSAVVWSCLEHTIYDRPITIVVTLRCRGSTAVTRIVDVDGVDTRCCIKSQLHPITDDGLIVRELIVKAGLSMTLVIEQHMNGY
jgi:hypothetical protein